MTLQVASNLSTYQETRSQGDVRTSDSFVVPTDRLLGDLRDGLRRNVMWDVNQWVATEYVTGMFGEGDTPDDAYSDLEASLRELRAHFDQYQTHLSTSQSEQLTLLRRIR